MIVKALGSGYYGLEATDEAADPEVLEAVRQAVKVVGLASEANVTYLNYPSRGTDGRKAFQRTP